MNGKNENSKLIKEQFIKEEQYSTINGQSSNILDIENQVNAKAIYLVDQASSLVKAKYYDDAIEFLRQAIGLYNQINKNVEIKAIRRTISEIYILKEQIIREVEYIGQEKHKISEREKQIEDMEVKIIEKEQEFSEEELSSKADKLIREAKILIEIEEFDDAVEKYEKAIKLYKQINSKSKIERTYELIEKCYDYKIEFLKKPEIKELKGEIKVETEKPGQISEVMLNTQKLKEYENSKNQGEQFINHAYNLMEQGSKLLKNKKYDQALILYEVAANLFKDNNFSNELLKVQSTIAQIQKEKELHSKELQIKKEKEGKEHELAERELSNKAEKLVEEAKNLIEIDEFDKALEKYDEAIKILKVTNNDTEIEKIFELIEKCYDYKTEFLKKPKIEESKKEEIPDNVAEQQIVIEEQERIKKIKEFESKKEEEENFKSQITELVDKAEKLAREYKIKKKKALKNNQLLEVDAPYHEIIEIYTKAKDMLIERGWTDQASIYQKQIDLYLSRTAQDKKLRAIETQKIQKQKEYEEHLKFNKIERQPISEARRIKDVQEKYQKELEDEYFEKQISEVIDNAERDAHEYEMRKMKAIKQGNLDFECIYPELITIYTEVRNKLLEKGWNDQATFFSNQIMIYKTKHEKDKKLREIEGQKIQKQKEYDEFIKIKRDKVHLKVKDDEFETKIYKMVDKAVKMERKYEFAIRRGKTNENPPYETIIKIYTNVKDMLLERGSEDEAKIYNKQIELAQLKIEKSKSK